jgi:TRAP-type C4-dicarboxylate transport system permease small subunit
VTSTDADKGDAPQVGTPDSIVDRVFQILCELLLTAMMLIVGAEALARGLAGIALEIADEMGGYLLVAFIFLSISVCQSAGTFHHLELVQARLTPRGRAVSALIFDLLALGFSAVLLWQLGRLAFVSWASGEVAQTHHMTPIWIPMLSMPLGAAALCFALMRSLIKDLRLLYDLRS